MDGKKVSESRTTLSRIMGPQDANSQGNVHGGVIMKMVDEAGAVAAMRHSRHAVVTVAIDSMTFKEPIRITDLVTVVAELTYVGRTSMEARVEVTAEHPVSGGVSQTNTAYLVYVALDTDGKPCEVPPLHLENEQEKQRWKNAEIRQQFRKTQRVQEERITRG